MKSYCGKFTKVIGGQILLTDLWLKWYCKHKFAWIKVKLLLILKITTIIKKTTTAVSWIQILKSLVKINTKLKKTLYDCLKL